MLPVSKGLETFTCCVLVPLDHLFVVRRLICWIEKFSFGSNSTFVNQKSFSYILVTLGERKDAYQILHMINVYSLCENTRMFWYSSRWEYQGSTPAEHEYIVTPNTNSLRGALSGRIIYDKYYAVICSWPINTISTKKHSI